MTALESLSRISVDDYLAFEQTRRSMCWLLRIPLPSRFIVAQPTGGSARL